MAGNQTVKDLDKKASLSGGEFEYFPLWYFKRRLPDGQEEIILQPAAATSVSELRRLRLPAGDLRKYDPALQAQMHDPSVPLQAALGWLEAQKVPAAEIAERALVHVPVHTFKYDFQGKSFTAIVEAATGGVFANIYPAKAEAPYQTVGAPGRACFPMPGDLSRDWGHPVQRRWFWDWHAGLQRFGAGGGPASFCPSSLGGGKSMSEKEITHGLTCPRCGGMVSIPEGQLIVKLSVL